MVCFEWEAGKIWRDQNFLFSRLEKHEGNKRCFLEVSKGFILSV